MKKNYFLTFLLVLSTNFLVAQAGEYLGEIRLFAGTYAPQGWAFCDGTLMSINQYSALYTVIGLQYGGNGTTNFALPDLRGRVPVGQGQQPGGSFYALGNNYGTETITLFSNQIPSHAHAASITVSSENASTTVPTSSSSIAVSGMNSGQAFVSNSNYGSGNNVILQNIITTVPNPLPIPQPVNLSRPKIGLNYIISLSGEFPSRQ
ncbi:tail fiber protein [Flavobacterium sp. 17A]|uniref:Tail fiber protein n=1 Tax=Flavobacterium potami TaxID=2872310 RepID=A0A9X1HEZ2_9FLAO|nr:tail fiber protein [Flavobacterium potami]MBZ4037606.1 tail fiber protein [Flavobacterium potami]